MGASDRQTCTLEHHCNQDPFLHDGDTRSGSRDLDLRTAMCDSTSSLLQRFWDGMIWGDLDRQAKRNNDMAAAARERCWSGDARPEKETKGTGLSTPGHMDRARVCSRSLPPHRRGQASPLESGNGGAKSKVSRAPDAVTPRPHHDGHGHGQ